MNEIKEWTWQDPLPLNPTLQQVFDKSLFSMRQQGQFSRDKETGTCSYLSESGASCGVGLLIESDKTKCRLDGKGCTGIKYLHENGHLTGELEYMNEPNMLELLIDIQITHDGSYNDWNDFRKYELSMAEVAVKHNLNYTPVVQ